ncbi:glycoside hydrolase family 43 protein [Natronosporangium hydrolyticum]|uniref:Glycoside hydrolase family 43 protein n=1 Tax=Natronosporangium hydrolyticum TaxID=2811111 RepID=A0A895YEG0_9ACTN|nr:glycoside hydrolase family 43 protein [Natronosporangium hydrolyticum]QSB12610.1 glycoside hydrolase family 43 protein [Natronosporangium hydrolyticum]
MTTTTPTRVSADPADRRLVRNPVLPGFHPDPSILRVGTDYYLATSTFEWYPGVRLHHSTDLVHWRALGGILTERRLLDLLGSGDSCGVWAPDLSYTDGLFYLVYTDVSSFDCGYWDSQNYLTSAPTPTGPWSDPVVLHARGFDASLFHDDDGTSWLLSMTADWRPGRDQFGGIGIQQFDRATQQLVGPERAIFAGTAAGLTEGPHLYRRDGWYYLLVAEGGTSWEHQALVARSRDLFGPYEPDPDGPLITSVHRPELPMQKAGHGSLVETTDGQWYLAHLVGRPYTPRGACVLGRETAIQPVSWPADGWPRVAGGVPADAFPAPEPATTDQPAAAPITHDHFDQDHLGPDWSTLRRPATPDWVDLSARPSHLRIYGGQSPVGRQRPSLVARRVTDRRCSLETTMQFRPANFRQLAGVTAYYNSRNWHFAYVTADDDGKPVFEVLSCDNGRRTTHPQCRVELSGVDQVGLRVVFDDTEVRFAHRLSDAADWTELPLALDATILSDEHAARIVDGEPAAWGFTGAMIGLWVQDLGADGGFADFDEAVYQIHSD